MVEQRDPLTGLIGTDAAIAQLGEWRARAGAEGRGVTIHAMLLGLKRFATVNLAYGEEAGDRALAEVARRLLHFAHAEFDRNWLAARVGGGAFLFAVDAPCSRERWHWLAEELAQAVAVPIVQGNGAVRLAPRVALLRAVAGEEPERMLGRLTETLEAAQSLPGARLQWVDGDLSPAGRPAQQLEADLLAALDRDEIEIMFQPQFACAGGKGPGAIVGAEALARWQHPQLGRIGAGALFAIAERADHVGQLSRHIAAKALAAAARWPGELRLSLNVTAADLAAGDFAPGIIATLAASGFAPDRLTLEITEQALVAEVDRSAERLRLLCESGIRIALDDFGAGFCNFRYLKLLPLHYLKLDHSMVEGIAEDSRDLAVLRGIIAMAHALGLAVIAEGIETEAQLAVVHREGCASWQGFLGARPMSAERFAKLAAG